MTNKTKTYVLLVVVLAIWGIVGYKIASTLNPDPPKIVKKEFDISFNPKTNMVSDTFSIKTVERDPFLGTLLVKKEPLLKRQTTLKAEWVSISYHGIITQQQSKNKVFVVSIEKEQSLIKIGQSIKGVKLVRGNNREIVVAYKNSTKTIKKE